MEGCRVKWVNILTYKRDRNEKYNDLKDLTIKFDDKVLIVSYLNCFKNKRVVRVFNMNMVVDFEYREM